MREYRGVTTVDGRPRLFLRMKSPTISAPETTPREITAFSCFDDLVHSLSIMITQDEEKYQCRDYLLRRANRRKEQQQQSQYYEGESEEEAIDAVCREKMCEWGYRVCDHFQTNREIVSFAFSFLDRFVDRCSCDRTAFKLAAMTSLYMATKLFNAKQISIASLAELSRGEFELSHIAEMERIILTTLDWRLNPPTVQSFITKLMALFPLVVEDDHLLVDYVYERALFFAELSVFDYFFVSERRAAVAVSCILTAVDGVEDYTGQSSRKIRNTFLSHVRSILPMSSRDDDLDESQGRLWYLYTCSAQLLDDDQERVRALTRSPRAGKIHSEPIDVDSFAYSPVSVRLHPIAKS
jgi:hypothetical protein